MCKNPFEERFLVIAEKPSVAMTIASVLGCKRKRDGYLESPDGAVSWCFGHLAEYAMPEAYDENYRKWSLENLPIIPDQWKLIVQSDKAKQFKVLCNLLNNRMGAGSDSGYSCAPFDYVVNACDAGREGELIFNRVYELSGSRLPVKRLWISSMEDDAIMEGFMSLKDAAEYRNLSDASVCRAQADWLVGINASRAFSTVYDCRLSVGRVQTPTLAMLVERGNQIDNFEKEQYFITHLLVDSMGNTIDAVSEHFTDREEANRLAGICNGRAATVPSIERRTKTVRPPKLYDLTTLQRDANRLFGLTAGTTLRCAQALYESKLITYPRTDSRYLTDDMGQTASDVLKVCFQTFPFLSQAETASPLTEISASAIPSVQGAESPNIGRLLDSRKVSDHHAIIPTIMIEKTDLSTLDKDQKKILTLIASRLVCATGQNHVYETVKATLLCCGYPFAAMGRIVKEEGWKAAETAMLTQCRAFSDEGKEEKESVFSGQDLSTLYQGAQFPSVNTKVTEHWTQPLNQYTEDTLLHAMEKAGASDMEADVERKGLGTPATRAGIIDKLVSSKYVSRNKRQLIATEAGRQLIEILPAYLTSPKMTADWENQLLMMERGEQDRQSFMGGITQLISQMLQECRQIRDDDKQRFSASGETIQGNHTRGGVGKCPVCGSPVYEGDKTFYCSNRDCSFVLWKHNHYLDRLRTALNSTMVQDLLEKGRTTVKNLYSVKKDSYFTADLLMEWKDNKAAYSLEFPKH